MSMRRMGSTQQYAEGWDRAFGKGTKTAKKATATKKKAGGTGRTKSASPKKATRKKAARAKK